jgi:hypothetical protein
VLASFNTWAIKREQPSCMATMEARIADAMAAAAPVPFVLYWGKGPRAAIAPPDVACLAFLASLHRRIGAVYGPGAEWRLVFTDTHAALNGHAAEAREAYFGAVARHADPHVFKTYLLGDIIRSAGPVMPETGPPSPALISALMPSARRWFRGSGSYHDGAVRYLHANLIERSAIERAFPDAIFATFNGSDFDFLFPQRMPRFYMYSLRKGCSVKPWFMDADGRVLESAD